MIKKLVLIKDGIAHLINLEHVPKEYIDTQDEATLNSSKGYADTQDVATLNEAKKYADNNKVSKSGDSMTGSLDMSGNNLENVYIIQVAAILEQSNGSGILMKHKTSFDNIPVNNVGDPVNTKDATNKSYVDTQDKATLDTAKEYVNNYIRPYFGINSGILPVTTFYFKTNISMVNAMFYGSFNGFKSSIGKVDVELSFYIPSTPTSFTQCYLISKGTENLIKEASIFLDDDDTISLVFRLLDSPANNIAYAGFAELRRAVVVNPNSEDIVVNPSIPSKNILTSLQILSTYPTEKNIQTPFTIL